MHGRMAAPTDKENDDLAAAFRVFDRTGQGIIPADEFANQAKILGEGLTDLEAAELLKYSQDGKLQYKGAFLSSPSRPSPSCSRDALLTTVHTHTHR
jgi:Ca2+-binding EF-hand superfamily protein